MTVKLLKDLDSSGNQTLSEIIIDNAIKEYEHSMPDDEVTHELLDYYSQVDHVLKSRSSTFEVELSKILGKSI